MSFPELWMENRRLAKRSRASCNDVGRTPSAPRRAELPVDQYAHEGAFFGFEHRESADGKPLKAGEVDFLIGHRFAQDIKGRWVGWTLRVLTAAQPSPLATCGLNGSVVRRHCAQQLF